VEAETSAEEHTPAVRRCRGTGLRSARSVAQASALPTLHPPR
jgi:hypothetical protein